MGKLASLLIDEDGILSDSISLGLQGIVHIGKGTGSVILAPEFSSLDRNSKILAYLLALRAATFLGVSNKVDATSEEIASVVGFDVKSASEYASRLKKNFLTRGPNGYTIPLEKLARVAAHLQEVRNAKEKNDKY